MKKKYYLIIAAVAVLVVLVVVRLAANKKHMDEKKQVKAAADIRIPVKVSAAAMLADSMGIVKTGSVSAFKETKIFSTSSGVVQRIHFELGTKVTLGQALAVIDSRQNSIDLSKAQSKAAKLESDVKTYTELYEGKAATREKLESLKQDYKDAQAEVEQAQRLIGESVVKAPISGTVSEKVLEAGVYVSVGTEMGTIVDLSSPKVQVWVTESEVYDIDLGQQVSITAEVYPDMKFTGKVSFISPQADEARNYLVEIIITGKPAKQLRSGTFINAAFQSKQATNRLFIPREVLIENMESPTVYIVDAAGKVSQRKIQTGREMKGFIQVRSGLAAGDQIVTSGQINLKEGTAVSVSK